MTFVIGLILVLVILIWNIICQTADYEILNKRMKKRLIKND